LAAAAPAWGGEQWRVATDLRSNRVWQTLVLDIDPAHGTRNGDALAFVATPANGRVYRFDRSVEGARSTALSAGATAFVHVAGATSLWERLQSRRALPAGPAATDGPRSKGAGTTRQHRDSHAHFDAYSSPAASATPSPHGCRTAHMLSIRFGYGRPFSSARCRAAAFCAGDNGCARWPRGLGFFQGGILEARMGMTAGKGGAHRDAMRCANE
jgi:hypothetical protein